MESSFVVLYIFFLASVYTSALDAGVDSDPSSEPSACSEIPIVENANVSTTSLKSNYTEGDSLIYSCQQGYIGRVTFVCNGKKWRNARNTTCSRKRCQLPEDIPNGRFVIINGTEFVYETTIKYICKTGYRMVSLMDTRTCLVEGWSNHLPHCEEIICALPVAKDNLIVDGLPDYDDNPLKYGHQLKFTCNSVKLKLVGPNEITCGENGEWSHPFPKCEVHKGCVSPPYVQFAVLANFWKSFYNSGERVEYHCQQLYTIEGDNFKTCVDGIWTGSVRCLKPCTATTEAMDAHKITQLYGEKRHMFSAHSDHITFKCQHGKKLIKNGVGFRQQCIDGLMLLPTCQ